MIVGIIEIFGCILSLIIQVFSWHEMEMHG